MAIGLNAFTFLIKLHTFKPLAPIEAKARNEQAKQLGDDKLGLFGLA